LSDLDCMIVDGRPKRFEEKRSGEDTTL